MQPTGINLGYITPYSTGIINLINGILVPVLIAVAFIVFLWGAYKYFIWGAENETEKADGRKFAMWGVIGFVIILSLWGIVNLVMGTFGLSVGKAPPYPTIGGSTGVTTGGPQYFTSTNVGTVGGTGSTIYSPNGSMLGSVNSSGQIVGSDGRVIGNMQNGQPYYTSGTRIVGATVSNGGSTVTNTTPEGYDPYTEGGISAPSAGGSGADNTQTDAAASEAEANDTGP